MSIRHYVSTLRLRTEQKGRRDRQTRAADTGPGAFPSHQALLPSDARESEIAPLMFTVETDLVFIYQLQTSQRQ
jgi:hypothetical protein